MVRTADRGVCSRRFDVREMRRRQLRKGDEHPRRVVRLRIEPRSRALGPPRAHLAIRCVSRGQRSASRLVPELSAPRSRHAGSRTVS
jgi:hypothetical protein